MKRAACGRGQAGRYGGEEFIVVAPGCDELECLRLADSIRESTWGTPIETPQGSLNVTCSLGAAVTYWATDEDSDSLIARADTALYRAKANGRSRTELAV